MQPKYMGWGWYCTIEGDTEYWDDISGMSPPIEQKLSVDPIERKKRLETLGIL